MQQLNPESDWNKREQLELEKVKKMEKVLIALWILVPTSLISLTLGYLRRKKLKRLETAEMVIKNLKI